MKVQERSGRLDDLGATALFVVHDDPEEIRARLLADVDELSYPVLVDGDRSAYEAWGLRRARWWRIWLDPAVWKQYAQLIARGSRLRGLGRDPLQLGGDFVVASDSTVAYSRPQRRDDRPPVGELLSVVQDLTAG